MVARQCPAKTNMAPGKAAVRSGVVRHYPGMRPYGPTTNKEGIADANPGAPGQAQMSEGASFNAGLGLRSLGGAGWQVVEIRRGVGGAAPAGAAHKQYAWDIRYIDAPVCRWWDADGDGTMEPAAGEMHYYTQDAQFNATALAARLESCPCCERSQYLRVCVRNTQKCQGISCVFFLDARYLYSLSLTDPFLNGLLLDANSGDVVERYLYDPYGRPTFLDANWTPIAASAYDNEILFCGYQRDRLTGLYCVRHRYYDPATGTWKTRDLLLYPDGMNLYEYCRSSGIGTGDPTGLTPWTTMRATESVQEIVGAAKDGIYGPETCRKVKVYQAMLQRHMCLAGKTGSGRDSVDGKWGDQTEAAYRCFYCPKLAQYMSHATQAMKTNISTIETMHEEQKWWQDYYTSIRWADAVTTVIDGLGTGVKAAKAAGAALRSRAVLDEAGDFWLSQAVTASETLEDAAKQGAREVAQNAIQSGLTRAAVSIYSILEVNEANRNKVKQYDPYIQKAIENIDSLSNSPFRKSS